MNMRVLVASSMHPVGDPRVFHKISVSLAKRYSVTLVAAGDGAKDLHGVSVRPFRKKGGAILGRLRAWSEIIRLYRLTRPYVFHFHDPDLILLGLFLRYFARCKVVYDVHEDVPKTLLKRSWVPSLLKRPLAYLFDKFERMAARRFHANVVVVPSLQERFKGANTVLVRNFPPLSPDRQRRPFDGTHPLRLIYVGSLTEVRGIVTIIEALSRVKVQAELMLLGRFHSDLFRQRVEEQMKGRPVKYLGVVPLEQVPDHLAFADIGLCCLWPTPNHEHSLATKLFEYMAARLPIIASDFPLWREMIQDAGCGLCVDPQDPVAIARAVDELAQAPSRRQLMGEKGRSLFEKEYNWTEEEKKLLNLYHGFERSAR